MKVQERTTENAMYDEKGKEVFAGCASILKDMTVIDLAKRNHFYSAYIGYSLDEGWVIGEYKYAYSNR